MVVAGGGWLRRRQAALRQADEQNRRRPQAVNRRWQTGQMIVPVSSRDGPLGGVGSGATTVSRCPQALGTGPVGAHPVAVAVDLEHGAAVQEPVEHGRGDHRVVEDPAP